MLILAINPGSTSTKLAVMRDGKIEKEFSVSHSADELSKFSSAIEQKDFRTSIIKEFLEKNGYKIEEFSAIAGRGAPIKPVESGVYKINDKMLYDLKYNLKADHPSVLGALIAYELATPHNIPCFIADPVSVDEFDDIARISGMPEAPRISLAHALNIKATAKRFAKEIGKKYEDMNLIICHLGGGISITAHRKGRMIDVNNANDDGPFSPERSGGLPAGQLVKLCFSGKYSSAKEMLKYLTKQAGLIAYLGTNNFGEMLKKSFEDKKIKLIIDSMLYQIAKEIGKMSAVLKGNVDYILTTGGIAYNKEVIDYLEEHVGFIAPIKNYPGENELLALCEAAQRVLKGEEIAKDYE